MTLTGDENAVDTAIVTALKNHVYGSAFPRTTLSGISWLQSNSVLRVTDDSCTFTYAVTAVSKGSHPWLSQS